MEYKIEETFQITDRGLVILVNAVNDFPPGKRFEVIIKDTNGDKVLCDTATQEWARKLRDDGSVESITFLMATAVKEQVPVGGSIVLIRDTAI